MLCQMVRVQPDLLPVLDVPLHQARQAFISCQSMVAHSDGHNVLCFEDAKLHA